MVGEALTNDGTVQVLGTTTIGGVVATPRQRSLIAALALAGPTGASIDVVADGVWAGRPPDSARASLQNQITRLRRAHAPDLIVCESSRYRLGWPTDVDHFEQACDTAVRAGDPTVRIEILERALAHWRGTPYADLDSHAAEVERMRLEGIRSLAVERLALSRLDAGAGAACVVDLRVEIERDPYCDRLWELLVIALHRDGRTAEALLAVEHHLDQMRREFGADPSVRMQDLAAAIRRERAVDARATPPRHHRSGNRCRTRTSRRQFRPG